MIFYRNLREITFRLTNVIPKRIIFVSRGITVCLYTETTNSYFNCIWRSIRSTAILL